MPFFPPEWINRTHSGGRIQNTYPPGHRGSYIYPRGISRSRPEIRLWCKLWPGSSSSFFLFFFSTRVSSGRRVFLHSSAATGFSLAFCRQNSSPPRRCYFYFIRIYSHLPFLAFAGLGLFFLSKWRRRRTFLSPLYNTINTRRRVRTYRAIRFSRAAENSRVYEDNASSVG